MSGAGIRQHQSTPDPADCIKRWTLILTRMYVVVFFCDTLTRFIKSQGKLMRLVMYLFIFACILYLQLFCLKK